MRPCFGPGTTIARGRRVPAGQRPAARLGWAGRRPRPRPSGARRAPRRPGPPGPGPAADGGREPDRGRRAGPARALSAGRPGPHRRHHRPARRGQVDPRRRADRARSGRPVGPVAVVAVDPSSPITGGAILGDRVRMQAYAGDRDVFIRSMAARGHAGDWPRRRGPPRPCSTRSASISSSSRPWAPARARSRSRPRPTRRSSSRRPEMGDEVQAIKAGLLEVADIVVVNKGDRPGAQRTAAQLRAMLVAAPRGRRGEPADRPRPKRPEVMVTTASTGAGVPELLVALDRHRAMAAPTRGTAAAAGPGRGSGPGDRGRPDRRPAEERPAGGPPAATLRSVAAHGLDPSRRRTG